MTADDLKHLAAQLKSLSESIDGESLPQIDGRQATVVRRTFEEVLENLQAIITGLDPIKQPAFVLDPSNPNTVARFIGMALVAQPRIPLQDIEKTYGSGVYALYYNGSFPAYQPISKQEHPIYVGKADPANPKGQTPIEQGDRLSNRINDHRKNLGKASDSLRLEDFEYRVLVVQSGWQEAAEKYLIHLFKPIWNNEMRICYGFGKHGDSAEIRANRRSPWDTLHEGRLWAGAKKLVDAKPKETILAEIRAHFRANSPFRHVQDVLRTFLSDMRSGAP